MLIILILHILVLTGMSFRYSFLDHLSFLATILHQNCLDLLPVSTKNEDHLAALVCGKNFSNPEESSLLIASGLIHLFVVSGSHLQIIKKFISKFIKHEFFILIILFFYSAICLFNPPVVRSFIFIGLSLYLTKYKKNWPLDYTLLVSGFLCLALKSEWVNSLSLQMSWIAVLTLAIIDRYLSHSIDLLQQILFYILFSITFLALGFPPLCSILICVIMTPFFNTILFPLSLCVFIFPLLNPIFDFVLSQLQIVLKVLELSTGIPKVADMSSIITLNWFLILGLHLLLNIKKPKS